tara:strand:+ start:1427 stop:1927 length:501 start_codon:yes stop_codon:yes gene_type:complete
MLINILKFSFIILCSTAFIFAEDDSLIIEIDNPKFSEKGLNDKTYEIKAKKGFKSDVAIQLFEVEGKFKSDNNGKWIYLEADQGNYNQSSNFIELKKNIKFYTDQGEILKSNYATFDMINDIIEFEDNISHETNEGIIIADKSVISKDFNNFEYLGNVYTKIKLNN